LLLLERADTVRELGEVARLVAEHFAHEERPMKASGYPDPRRHADAHRLFVADLRASQVELAKNGVSEKFRRWLTGRALDWFRFHIVTHDVSLGLFLHHEAQTEAALASAGPAASLENRKPS
jgi:hemerythrin-like metal-binding protein